MMREELPALTTWQQIGLILATPGYDANGEAFLDEGDMTSVAVLLDTYKAERDAELYSLSVVRDAARAEADEYRAMIDRCRERNKELGAECERLRDALVSLVDGKSEFDVKYDTGMDADEARRIMDLAYQRSDNSAQDAA